MQTSFGFKKEDTKDIQVPISGRTNSELMQAAERAGLYKYVDLNGWLIVRWPHTDGWTSLCKY